MLNPDRIALQFAEGLLLDMIAEMDRFLSDDDAAYEDWCERVVPKRHDDCFAVMQIIVKALHGNRAALADERAVTANVIEAAQELLLFLNDQPSELAQDILTGNLSDMLHRAAIAKAEGTPDA